MKILLYDECEKLLKKFNFASYSKIKELKELKEVVEFLGFPIVLKVLSKNALHKTDFGLVKICRNKEEIDECWFGLLNNIQKLKLKEYKIIAQEFIKGIEVFAGIKRDETFGHIILFGLGGIFVEVLRDVSIRVCPISKKDAKEMIEEIKGKKILFGYRGMKANINFLKKFLVKLSKVPLKYENIQELDINPLIINEKEGKIVDCRIIFS